MCSQPSEAKCIERKHQKKYDKGKKWLPFSGKMTSDFLLLFYIF